MASRHTILVVAATFALLFVAVMASTITTTTTTTTTTVDSGDQLDENPRQRQQLNACQQYLVESTGYPSSWREEFQECCRQLEQVDEQCRCQGIKRIVQRLQEQEQEQRVLEMEEMVETAKSLPGLCRMGPRRCDIQALSTFS